MTLPVGQISLGEVNVELGLSATAQISLNDAAVRSLAGVPSGAISMSNLQGKSNDPTFMASLYSAVWGYYTFVDSSGNIYQANQLPSPSTIQVVKLDGTAAIQWQRSLASTNPSYPGNEQAGIVADSSGNVFAISVSAATGVNNIYIAKYNSSGTLQWQKVYGDASNTTYTAGGGDSPVAIDSGGNPHVTVVIPGNVMGVTKFNTSGAIVWQSSIDVGPGGNSSAQVLTIDSSDNVYAAGYIYGGEFNGTLVKLNSSGTTQWVRRVTDPVGYFVSVWFRGVDTDSSGNIYLAAQGNNNTCYVIKFDSSGNFQWNRRLSISGGNTNPRSIAVDASGNSYILGGNASLVYVAKYNSSGTLQWQRSFVSTSIYPFSITLNSSGTNYYINGTFDAAVTSFYVKLPTDGSKTGTYTVNGQTVTYGASSLTDGAYTLATNSPSYSTGTISRSVSNSSFTAGTPTKSNAVTNV